MTSDAPQPDLDPRRCPHCLAPLGERDRLCFSCRRPLPLLDAKTVTEPPLVAETVATAVPDPLSDSPPPLHSRFDPSGRLGGSRQRVSEPTPPPGPSSSNPEPAITGQNPHSTRARAPSESAVLQSSPPLSFELQWGRVKVTQIVPPGGCSIGSTELADVVLPAPFLSPIHARVVPGVDGFEVVPASPESQVLLSGRAAGRSALVPGAVVRLADRVGNFATLRVARASGAEAVHSGLRGALPAAGASVVIGSGENCAIRLDHPLVRPRHAVLRRDESGHLWLEDRTTVAGTYVNGRRLRGRVRLAHGDNIQVGPASAQVGEIALEPLVQVPGVDVTADGACFDVMTKRLGPRRLLTDISLHLQPASLTAVAGPSGAGKTTLMRLLSGQNSASAGQVRYNGVDLRSCREAHAALMGFVPQDDVVHADLTVAEALEYQARLRLGREATAADRNASIARAIAFVGLEDQRDQLVRTLSGGQRKRTSIAAELLNEPEVLFLDEPTSGLDPGLDKRMMLLLRLLADQGRTVILTTHAIAYVDVCDTLVLVGPGGHLIYAGHSDDAPSWFGVPSLGDVFSLIDTPEAAARAATRMKTATIPAVVLPPPAPLRVTAAPVATGTIGIAKPAFASPAWRETVFHQGRIFAERYVRLLSRDRTALTFSLLQGVAVALITALVAPKPLQWALQGSGPTFVLGCSAVWFGMINAVRELVKERTIWRREELAGANASAYLASKVAVLGTLAAVQALSTVVALALTIHLPNSSPVVSPPFAIVVTLWLANLAGMAMGLVVSALAPSSDRAMSIVPYLLITQLVLCGVLFPLGAVSPISWVMPARWAVSALGGVAGLSAASLHQSSGLYPHNAIGLIGNWSALLLLGCAGVAVTGRILDRQAASWSVG